MWPRGPKGDSRLCRRSLSEQNLFGGGGVWRGRRTGWLGGRRAVAAAVGAGVGGDGARVDAGLAGDLGGALAGGDGGVDAGALAQQRLLRRAELARQLAAAVHAVLPVERL